MSNLMSPDDIPTVPAVTFLGISLATGNPLIGGLAAGGLVLTGKALSFAKRKIRESRDAAARSRQERFYRADREAQRQHELEIERLKNPPPLPHEELLDKVRREFEQNLAVIEASSLRENEKAAARDRITQKFIRDLEKSI